MAALAAMQGRARSSGRRPGPVRPLPSTFSGNLVPQGTGGGARRRLPDWLHGSRPQTSACVSDFAHAAGARHGIHFFLALPMAWDTSLGTQGACTAMRGGIGGTGRGVSRQDRRTAFGMPVPAVAGFLACEPASPAGANGCNATGRLPVSAANSSRTRPCRDAGIRAMTAPDGRCRGCRAAERSPGPENVTRDRTFVENQPLARSSGRRGTGLSDAGLLAIAIAIGSKVVNAAPEAAARPTRRGTWKPAPEARQPVELTHVFRDRTDPRRPFGQDEGPAARGGFCSR